MSFENLARPAVRGFSPYVPGKPIEEIRERFGLRDVVKLASNENPLGPSPAAIAALAGCAADLHRYPEGGSTRLRRAIARRLHVEEGSVIVGSGSDELIEIIAKAFLDREDSTVVSAHAFIRYKMAGALMGARVIEVPMAGYRHDLRAMAAAVRPDTKVVFIANPNNPTGTHVTGAELEALLAAVPPDRLVVVDEAYFEYARSIEDYPDSVALRRAGHPNLVALRTFSKAYGLAGLRVGYGIADSSVVSQMDRIRPPFNVSIPSQAACEAALADEAHVERATRLNREGRDRLCRELERSGVEFVPPAGNFVLIRTAGGGAAMFEGLLRRGVIVRPMAEYGFPEHVRVTVGTPDELDLFLRSFLELNRAGRQILRDP